MLEDDDLGTVKGMVVGLLLSTAFWYVFGPDIVSIYIIPSAWDFGRW
jgi:hypothetical protein